MPVEHDEARHEADVVDEGNEEAEPRHEGRVQDVVDLAREEDGCEGADEEPGGIGDGEEDDHTVRYAKPLFQVHGAAPHAIGVFEGRREGGDEGDRSSLDHVIAWFVAADGVIVAAS